MLKRTIILAAFVSCVTVIAQRPERKVVNNNIIISDHDPKVRIELPKSVWYVGVDRFVPGIEQVGDHHRGGVCRRLDEVRGAEHLV